MKDCLFVQWKKPTDASRFVIDGNVSEYRGTELQNKVVKLLTDVPQYKEICKNDGIGNFSSSFRCSYLKANKSIWHFIEGNFKETDASDRNLVYIFATREPDSGNAANTLLEYSRLLEVSPFESDIEKIRQLSFQKKNSFGKIILIICLIIVLTILLLSYM